MRSTGRRKIAGSRRLEACVEMPGSLLRGWYAGPTMLAARSGSAGRALHPPPLSLVSAAGRGCRPPSDLFSASSRVVDEFVSGRSAPPRLPFSVPGSVRQRGRRSGRDRGAGALHHPAHALGGALLASAEQFADDVAVEAGGEAEIA